MAFWGHTLPDVCPRHLLNPLHSVVFPIVTKALKISIINSPRQVSIDQSFLCIKIGVNKFLCSCFLLCPRGGQFLLSIHSQIYASTSLMIIKSTVLGNVFRRETAFPWSIFTKLYPFAWIILSPGWRILDAGPSGWTLVTNIPLSSGRKGFPRPPTPPDILKPSSGFFSTFTRISCCTVSCGIRGGPWDCWETLSIR